MNPFNLPPIAPEKNKLTREALRLVEESMRRIHDIRTSGRWFYQNIKVICWTNVTRYLKGRKDRRGLRIVFQGEKLDMAAV